MSKHPDRIYLRIVDSISSEDGVYVLNVLAGEFCDNLKRIGYRSFSLLLLDKSNKKELVGHIRKNQCCGDNYSNLGNILSTNDQEKEHLNRIKKSKKIQKIKVLFKINLLASCKRLLINP